MTEIVRIVPRQPIEARLVDGGCAYFWVDSGGVERAGTPSDWVEVSDPIVWDGTDTMVAKVAAALPTPWWCHKAVLMPHDLRLRLVNNTAGLDVWIEPGWRIQAIGDSFVILPPKDGDA